MNRPRLPAAPRSIQRGTSLNGLHDWEAIACLAHNISLVHPDFDGDAFQRSALNGLEPLAILQRGQHLAHVLRKHLPGQYCDVVRLLIRSLTPPLTRADELGLGVFFYLPHVYFVA